MTDSLVQCVRKLLRELQMVKQPPEGGVAMVYFADGGSEYRVLCEMESKEGS